MSTSIFVLETSSAHLRARLGDTCAKLAPTKVFASANAARQAIASTPPAVFVVGGAPLLAAAEALRAAVERGIPSFAFVQPPDQRLALQLGACESCDRSEQAIDDLGARIAPFLSALLRTPAPTAAVPRGPSSPIAPRGPSSPIAPQRPYHLIAIGASTGGPEAISRLLAELPPSLPGIVIIQHMPSGQTSAFAERLDHESQWTVREARDGDRIENGVALIAPGGRHIRLLPAGLGLAVTADGPVLRHVPNVDVFFGSVARELASHAIGVLLTGMGDDGAQGLLAMRDAGAFTIAQSAASCAVFGMPRRAIELGAACEVVELAALAARLTAQCATAVTARQA